MKTYVVPETKYYKITTDDLLQAIGVGSNESWWDGADANRRYYTEENEDDITNYKYSIWED